MEANQLFNRFKNKTNIVFGGKLNFVNLCKDKITKDQYKEKRLLPINIQGEKLVHGNRKFKLNIIDENFIEFKMYRKEHYILHLPKLKKNYREILYKLQELNECGGYTYSIKLNKDFIFISFEEFKQELNSNRIENRFLAMDMNPDNIGISIIDYVNDRCQVVHTQQFNFEQIFDKILGLNLASSSLKFKYYQNKLNYEVIEVSKQISKLAKHFQCNYVFYESLKFNKNVSNKYNKLGNRKCRDLWKRNLFIQNLNKRLNIFGIKSHYINPAYSSFIGNLKYNYIDSINSSMEIGRRGFEIRVLKNKNSFYPAFTPNSLKHQWKEMASECRSWKELFQIIKNSKLRYRVPLEDVKEHLESVFSLNQNQKSMVLNYVFYD